MKNILCCICLLLSLGKVTAQVPTLHVLDTLRKDHLLKSLVDTNKNHIVVFWGSWSYNSKTLLEDWKTYSQNWIDHYNIEILCVSVFSDSSQIQIAQDLWHDRGWIGKLYFANTTEVTNIGIVAVPWTFLINPADSTLYTHIGYMSGDVVELNQFILGNLPLGSINPIPDNPDISIVQHGHSLKIESQSSLKGCTIDLYTIDGKLLFSDCLNTEATEFELPASIVLSNRGVRIVHLKRGVYSKSALVYLR